MTTITITKDEELPKTQFENLSDLQDYLTLYFFDDKKEFSDEFKKELNQREESLISGKEPGIPWKEVKSKMING